jgi:hypothetical protein
MLGAKKLGARIKMLQSPIRALARTDIGRAHTLASETMQQASEVAQITGGKAQTMVSGMQTKAQGLRAGEAKVGKGIAGFFAPLRKAVGGWLDQRSATGILGKPLQWLTDWRLKANTGKVEQLRKSAHEGIREKLTHVAETLVEEAAKKKGTVDPKVLAAAKETDTLFAPLKTHMAKGEGLTGVAKALHLEEAAKEVERLLQKGGLDKKAAKAAYEMRDALVQAASHERGLVGHTLAAASGSVRTMLKNAMKMGGRSSVLAGIITVGAAAGVAAAFAVAKKDNKEAKQALSDMKQDVGNADHPMIQSASKMEKKLNGRRFIGATAQAAGEGLNATMMGFAGGGMASNAAMMGAQMGLPQVAQMLVPQNQVLNAYANLKKVEQQGVKIEPEQKLQLMKQLVAGLPSVEQQGGIYNRLTEPVAKEILSRNLNLRDTMRLLTNDRQFTELAAEVKGKQDALRAAAAAAMPAVGTSEPKAPAAPQVPGAPAPVVTGPAPTITTTPETQIASRDNAAAAMVQAAKPALMVAGNRALEGRVDMSQQLAAAAV